MNRERLREKRELRFAVEQVNSGEIARLNFFLRLQLNQAYSIFSKNLPGFPNGYCDKVVLYLSKKLHLRFVQGRFAVDDGLPHKDHAWNMDAKGTIIDFTAKQFDPFLN